jgi:hypothetical protein
MLYDCGETHRADLASLKNALQPVGSVAPLFDQRERGAAHRVAGALDRDGANGDVSTRC